MDTVLELKLERIVASHLYDGPFRSATGIAWDRFSGELLVTDGNRSAIAILDARGAPLFSFTDPEHLVSPRRVAADRDGQLYVLDSDNARVKVFDYRGVFLSYLQLPGFTDRKGAAFTAITFDADGNLYLADTDLGQVLVFDPARKLLARIGRKGTGKGELTAVGDVEVDADNVYVLDQVGLAVQVFTRYGRFLRGWGRHESGTENVSLPQGLAIDPKGRIVVIDTLRQEIKYFEAHGDFIDRFGGLGADPGAVAYPADVAVDAQGRLWVADNGNGRVQVFSTVEGPPKKQKHRAR